MRNPSEEDKHYWQD